MLPAWIRPAFPAAALTLVLLAAGCARKPNPEQQVKDGMAFAKQQFEQINRDPGAAAAFGSLAEMGGAPLAYLTARIRDPAGLPAFSGAKPSAPYTVAVSYDQQQRCFVIEGYTRDLAKPALVERVADRRPAAPANPPRPAGAAGAPAAADKAELNAALLEASVGGNTGTVAALLAQGADVNARSSEDGTPLMYACAKGHAALVQMLLAAGADPQARAADENGWPVIMLAAESGSPEIMARLLEKGADPNATDRFKNTPLMLAALRGHTGSVELLIKAGARLDAQETRQNNFPLLHAVSRGNAEVAAGLIRAGANVNLADQAGMTALMSCAENGQVRIAADLIKARANLEARLTGEVGAGATALMLAAAKGREEMVRLLLNSGANAKAADNNRATAARYAAHNNHPAIAGILQAAEQGAIPRAPAAAAPAAAGAPQPAGSPAGDPEALVGKEPRAADEMFGKPIGVIKQGATTVIKYRNAEVMVKQNVITRVQAAGAPARPRAAP